MEKDDTIVAVFDDHQAAEAAVKKLAGAGIDIKHLSVVGKGYHIDEKVVGFYNTGDRVKFWGKLGAFWGGLWGWLGGLFLTIPVVGHVIVLGYLPSSGPFCDRGRNRGGWPERAGRRPLQHWYPERQRDRIRGGRESRQISRHGARASGRGGASQNVLKAFNPSRLDLHEGTKTADIGDHPVHAAT